MCQISRPMFYLFFKWKCAFHDGVLRLMVLRIVVDALFKFTLVVSTSTKFLNGLGNSSLMISHNTIMHFFLVYFRLQTLTPRTDRLMKIVNR